LTELPLGPGLHAFVPDWHALAGFLGLLVTLAICLGLGALALGRDSEPEVQVTAGWGVLSIVLTACGVATNVSLRIPLLLLLLVAAASFAVPRLRERVASARGAGVVLALSVPLWAVMLAVAPSQVDTWLNLLPNAAWLFDHGRFPGGDAPAWFSFIPGAPYNTQFIAFAASVFSGSLAASAMCWFNVALGCVAAVVLARHLPGWGEFGRRPLSALTGAAFGLLFTTTPLNPGFVPRYDFAPYGEWPLAVTAMIAGLLGTRLIVAARAGLTLRRPTLALALVLAALVNIKQSGPGLALALGMAMLAASGAGRSGRAARATSLALLPAAALFALWQLHVRLTGAAELEVAPPSAWNIGLLPVVLGAMLRETLKFPALFLLLLAVLAGACIAIRRREQGFAAMLLIVAAGTILLDNAYLLASYVVHSEPVAAAEAHSFFRYNTQLSLLAVLAVAVWLRPHATVRWARITPVQRRRLKLGSIGAALIVPFGFAPYLRIDLDAPQPTLAALGRAVAAQLRAGERVALVLPGDGYDALGSLLRGEILFLPPRVAVADFATFERPDLDAIAKAGFDHALLSCAPAAWGGAEGPAAALLARAPGGWRTVGVWRYPPALYRNHFAALLPRGALCGGP